MAYVRNVTDCDILIAPDTRSPNEAAVCDYTIKVTDPRVADREGVSIDDVLGGWDGWHAEFVNDAGFDIESAQPVGEHQSSGTCAHDEDIAFMVLDTPDSINV